MKPKNNTELLLRIRQGDESVIDEIYQTHRTAFINWLRKKYNCDLEDAKEIFQISVITLYDNVVSGKLSQLTSSLNTYLYSIGGNKMREWRRSQKRTISVDDLLYFDQTDHQENKQEKESIFKEIENALSKLGEPCKSLLEQVYYYKSSMKLICERLGYKNEATARNAKYKCLQRLKKSVNILLNPETKI